jgi:hypothetical protein
MEPMPLTNAMAVRVPAAQFWISQEVVGNSKENLEQLSLSFFSCKRAGTACTYFV